MTPASPERARTSFNQFSILHLLTELVLIVLAGTGAFLLRFEFSIPAAYWRHLQLALLTWIPVKLVVFRLYHLDRRSWRFFSAADAIQLGRANVIGSLSSALLLVFAASPGFPRSIPILDFLLCSLLTGGGFLAARVVFEARTAKNNDQARDILIYGAGRAGVALLSELRLNQGLGYRVCGFIDDDRSLPGIYVQGCEVLGGGPDLPAIVARTGVKEVLIATPSANGEQMFQILKHCQQARVRFRTVAALSEIVEDKAIASQLREVDVEDLLCRTSVHLDHRLIREKIEGKVVMVTGGGGSIGSEICRQVARFRPAGIVAFEIAETPLFHSEREMQARFPGVPFYPAIGSVQNPRRIASVLEMYRPSLVYHAAAYKHVSVMESSLFEAVENNVFGTWNMALASQQHGVEEFVLISSDKAVRPTSVMGATKRLCELLILSLPSWPTRYIAVRFGNVLGSNGSVIPLFKEQIAAGGPVTVTDPEMRRYFMTIPEASQLVLQASAMGRGGEIFVLDMGFQIKIVDLARKLILLSGLRPDVDIKIEFTGAKPGEKLYEELNLDDEAHVRTGHQKIKIFAGNGLPSAGMLGFTEKLRKLCNARDHHEVLLLMRELVPEYSPSAQVLSVAPDARSIPPQREVGRLRPAAARAAVIAS